MRLPEAFQTRAGKQLGDELPLFLEAISAEPVRGIRINPLKDRPVLACYRTDPVPWEANGYYLPAASEAGKTIPHEAGAFYLQEPSAMLPASVLNAQPGEWVLDLCAAPGGKSTQIGTAMKGQGLLVCNEPVMKRAAVLSRNIERMGITNTLVVSADPGRLSAKWAGCFDAVIADVPCSGEGMFRRDPETRGEWTEDKAAGCAERQRGILKEAAKLVRPGGRLVYSTCTYNPAENEQNMVWFTATHPEFVREAFTLPGIDAPDGMFTCWPHRIRGEGQFVALLRRTGEAERRNTADQSLPRPDMREIQKLSDSFPAFPKATLKLKNTLTALQECPDVKGIPVLRAGLHLAEIRGEQVLPDHACAVNAFPPENQCMQLDPKTALRYLAGETFETEMKGWTILTYLGFSLGWGKGADGIMKNHYPKGLRNNRLIP